MSFACADLWTLQFGSFLNDTFFLRAISELSRNFACTRSLCHRLLLQASIGQVNGLSAQWQNWALQMSALEGCQNPSTSSCISGVFGLTSLGQDFSQNLLCVEPYHRSRQPPERKSTERNKSFKLKTKICLSDVSFSTVARWKRVKQRALQ